MAMEEGHLNMRAMPRWWSAFLCVALILGNVVLYGNASSASASIPTQQSPAPVVPEAPKGASYLLPISAIVILAGGGGLLAMRARRRSTPENDEPQTEHVPQGDEPASPTADVDEPDATQAAESGGREHE
jgi:hypothetical protein